MIRHNAGEGFVTGTFLLELVEGLLHWCHSGQGTIPCPMLVTATLETIPIIGLSIFELALEEDLQLFIGNVIKCEKVLTNEEALASFAT